MQVFTAAQMQACDEAAAVTLAPSVLMENAALRVVELVEVKFAPLRQRRVVVACGKGNNGGDGLAIARHLAHFEPQNLLVMMPVEAELGAQAADEWRALEPAATQGRVTVWHYAAQVTAAEVAGRAEGCDLFIDALLGTGATGPLRPPYAALVEGLNQVPGRVAVDLVSGVNADTGAAPENASLRAAQFSVTFGGPRRGHLTREGLELCGEVWVGDLGVPGPQPPTGCDTLGHEEARLLAQALQRPLDSNKGQAGRVLVVGGAPGMTGAAVLASRAALRVGAGLCTAALPEASLPALAAGCVEATSRPLPCDSQGRLTQAAHDEVASLWENVQVVALGPGLSRGKEALLLARFIVAHCPQPLVVDADALYALNDDLEGVQNRKAPLLLTPHPGEMGHLMGLTAKQVNADRFEVATACAAKYRAWVVLKGSRSVVSSPEGELFVNLTGNPGMATGGAGDVLTGTLAGLMGQIKEPGPSLKLAVHLHGLSGDLAFAEAGIGLTAGDIADHLPQALLRLRLRDASTLDPADRINGRLRRLR